MIDKSKTIEELTENKRDPIRDMYERMYRKSTSNVPTDKILNLITDKK